MTKRKAVAPGEGGTGPAPDGPRPVPCETAAAVAEAAAQVAGRRDLSGSDDSGFTLALLNQAWRAAWRGDEAPPAAVEDLLRAMVEAGLAGVAPRDPLEGMLAVQMVATHDAALACFHRAHQPGRRHDLRQADLAQANRLVRSYAALLEGLDRHRGKGRQVVRVEHVHVHSGGRAIVGAVSRAGGGGMEREPDVNPVRGRSPMHLSPRCGARTRSGSSCRQAAVKGKRRCRMHGGAAGSGAPSGARNGRYAHGQRAAEALAWRRRVRELLRAARELLGRGG